MNPFKNKIFEIAQFKSAELNKEREEYLKDKDFVVDDLVEWFMDLYPVLPSSRTMIDQLYYVYATKTITDKIGMSKPHTVGTVGGFLKEDFYTKLYNKLPKEGKAQLFAYMPGSVQTDDMLINYLENVPDGGSGSISNFRGEKLKHSTLSYLIDNRLSSVKDWKPEWWTPSLKKQAIEKEPFIIAFIPENLNSKNEIKQFLKEHGSKNQKYMTQFWINLPESYKLDPEIFAMWLISAGGLQPNKVIATKSPYYTKEAMYQYFKLIQTNSNYEWNSLPNEWKPFLLEVAIDTATGAIANDLEVDLTNSLIKRVLTFPMRDNDKAFFAVRLQKMGLLTKELIEKLDLNWWGVDHLYGADKKTLIDDTTLVIDYLIKKKDKDFLAKKDNWPKKRKISREDLMDIIIGLNCSYIKIKSRINVRFTEDDYVWLWLEANKYVDKLRIRDEVLGRLVKDNYIPGLSTYTINLLDQLGPDATYEQYKLATDIFIF